MEVDATSHVHSNFKYEVDISSLLDSCRVCMAQSFNMSSIFDAEKENIIEEIQFCTGITIKQETGLPSQICELCLNNLSVAYKFKTSCLVADETFRKLIVTPVIKTEQPELIEYEYESIIDYKNANDDDFEVVKEELIEVVLNEDGERNSGGVKVKNRGLPLQIIGDIVIEHDNNQMEVDDGNLTIDHVQKPRQIIGVRLNKVPKTSAERGREFRARKALLKQQCKQQQEPDAIVEIATEDIQSAGPSEKNQVPEPSEITTIEKRAKSAEATRRWREKKKGVSESSKKQAKTAAQRMREYRERKKLAKKILLEQQSDQDLDAIVSTSSSQVNQRAGPSTINSISAELTRIGNSQSQQQIEGSERTREYRERRNGESTSKRYQR